MIGAVARILGVAITVFVAAFALMHIMGCTAAQKKVITSILDVGDAVCNELGNQPDPASVAFICSVVSTTDGVAHTFEAHVKVEDAAKFQARHCSAGGSVAP